VYVFVQDVKIYSTAKGFIAEDLIRKASTSPLKFDEIRFLLKEKKRKNKMITMIYACDCGEMIICKTNLRFKMISMLFQLL